LIDNLDSLGSWHNGLMDFIYQNMVDSENEFTPCDTTAFRNNYNAWLTEWYEQKAVQTEGDFFQYYGEDLDGQTLQESSALSSDANEYIKLLEGYIEDFDDLGLSGFQSSCDALIADCVQMLSDDTEKVIIGTTIATAKHSAEYWYNYYSNWENLLHSYSCSPASYSARIDPRAKRVLQHDAAGALTGALSGLAGGPVTAFVGGLLGGGTKSVIHGFCEGFGITHITDWFGL